LRLYFGNAVCFRGFYLGNIILFFGIIVPGFSTVPQAISVLSPIIEPSFRLPVGILSEVLEIAFSGP
jgi:hypothetical protein